MAETSPRYRGLEGHACPRCADEGKWVHLMWLYSPEPGKPQRCYARKSDKREFRDDTKITKWVKEGGVERPKELWVHRWSVMCPRCSALLNKETYTWHVFEDNELPLDYWADHEENLALMRSRGISDELLATHERILENLGIRRQQ